MAQRQRDVVSLDEASASWPDDGATYIRELLGTAMATHGPTAASPLGDADPVGSLETSGLVEECLRQPRELWPNIVAAHVTARARDAAADPFQGLSAQQIHRGTYLRLQSVSNLADPGSYPYAREVAPGIVELLVFHGRKMSLVLGPDDVERFGGLDFLRSKGLANLRRVNSTDETVIDTPEGGCFRRYTGSSPFTASTLLVWERLGGWEYPRRPVPYGLLAAMPLSTEVAVHTIRDDTALASISGLAAFARLRARSASEPLSPHVFWVSDHHFEQVTDWDDHGALRRKGGAEFTALLEDLAMIGHIRPDSHYGPGYADS